MNNWKEIAKDTVPNEFNTFMKGDGRRPDSVIFSDITTDVKRRDLTINALFYDISTKEIVDLVGGIKDIKNGVVRTVGNADERFGEDRLRILRAVRFAARMGSQLDSDIDKALLKNSSLEGVSSERIRDEFLKGIKTAKSTKYYFNMLRKYKLFDWIFKGIPNISTWEVESKDEILLISLLLVKNDFNKLSKALNALNYKTSEVNQIVFLIQFVQTFDVDEIFKLKKLHINSKVSEETFKQFIKFLNIEGSVVEKFIKFQLTITGQYVKDKFNMKDGPELGQKIKELETQKFLST